MRKSAIPRYAWALSICAGLVAAMPAAAIDFPEIEPNDQKPAATVVNNMQPGDTLSGDTTGTSTTVAGPASADYFDITTAAAPAPGIYQYRLVITTSGTAGHTGTLRGLSQSAGFPNLGTDAELQASSTVTSPPRFVQWYANEQPSRVYFRVTGTSSTTSPYTVTLERTQVVPQTVPSPVPAGSVILTTVGQTTTDTDTWLYDGAFNPIVDAGNDDTPGVGLQSRLVRSLTAGTYIAAISRFNTANDLGSPFDDNYRLGNVADFPNVLMNSDSGSTSVDLDFQIGNRCEALQSISNTRSSPYEITFWQFTVTDPPLPDPCPPPANDNCSGAITISTPFSEAVNAEFASGDVDVACNAGANFETRHGLWYRYQVGADGGNLIFNETTGTDVVIALFTGADCNSLVETFCTTGETNQALPVEANTEYWILVGTFSDTAVPAAGYAFSIDFVPMTGACCTGSSCFQALQSQCSGTFLGVNVACSGYNRVTNSNPFVDISGTGTLLTGISSCDDCGQSIPIGFTFDFLGNLYTNVRVVTNGFIQFAGTSSDWTNVAIPNTATPNNFIAPLWDDFDPLQAGDVYSLLEGAPGSQRLIVSWQNVPQHNVGDSNSFQVVLHEGTNDIEFRYGSISFEAAVGDYTIGYEDASGTSGQSIPGSEIGGGNISVAFSTASPCGGGGMMGACCRGTTCAATAAGDCTGFAAFFSGENTVCNAFGVNNLSPCCLADYNHVGGVTVQDIFDFLSGYFGQHPYADINGLGGVTVQDIFDYLSTYFAGCN